MNMHTVERGNSPISADEQFSMRLASADNLAMVAGSVPLIPATNPPALVIVDGQHFSRDCLARCLRAAEAEANILTYESVVEWKRTRGSSPAPVVLLCAAGQQATETAMRRDIEAIRTAATDAMIIVVSDVDTPSAMVEALQRGARGYITTNMSLAVSVEAIRLVRAGGTYIPASGLLRLRSFASSSIPDSNSGWSELFTERQFQVIQALRKGDSNKIIAYNLKMGECTVKVHIRNIMKKIKAKNRTEIAFLTKSLFNGSHPE